MSGPYDSVIGGRKGASAAAVPHRNAEQIRGRQGKSEDVRHACGCDPKTGRATRIQRISWRVTKDRE